MNLRFSQSTLDFTMFKLYLYIDKLFLRFSLQLEILFHHFLVMVIKNVYYHMIHYVFSNEAVKENILPTAYRLSFPLIIQRVFSLLSIKLNYLIIWQTRMALKKLFHSMKCIICYEKNALITQLTDKNGLAPKDIHNTDV